MAVLQFTVTDNGCGIDAADQARLFEPFVQVRAGLQQRGKGTGLGLYICREIVKRHGGSIDLSSAVGRGTRITFSIAVRLLDPPVHARPGTAAGSTAAGVTPGGGGGGSGGGGVGLTYGVGIGAVMAVATNSGTSPMPLPGTSDTPSTFSVPLPAPSDDGGSGSGNSPATGGKPSLASLGGGGGGGGGATTSVSGVPVTPVLTLPGVVLVVDDDSGSRTMLARQLTRRLNCAGILQAGDGADAVAQFTNRPPGSPPIVAVCIDESMPIMGGPAAIEQLRARGFNGLIIGISGTSFPHALLSAGADAVHTKPVGVDSLLATFASRFAPAPPPATV